MRQLQERYESVLSIDTVALGDHQSIFLDKREVTQRMYPCFKCSEPWTLHIRDLSTSMNKN